MAHAWLFPCQLDGAPYDGDTFKLRVDLGFALRHHVSVRLHGADTPELRGGTAATKALARLARDEAFRFVAAADEVIFASTAWRGKYGRPVGDLVCDGKGLAAHLIAEGLAVRYDGGSRADLFAQHEKNARAALAAGRIVLED